MDTGRQRPCGQNPLPQRRQGQPGRQRRRRRRHRRCPAPNWALPMRNGSSWPRCTQPARSCGASSSPTSPPGTSTGLLARRPTPNSRRSRRPTATSRQSAPPLARSSTVIPRLWANHCPSWARPSRSTTAASAFPAGRWATSSTFPLLWAPQPPRSNPFTWSWWLAGRSWSSAGDETASASRSAFPVFIAAPWRRWRPISPIASCGMAPMVTAGPRTAVLSPTSCCAMFTTTSTTTPATSSNRASASLATTSSSATAVNTANTSTTPRLQHRGQVLRHQHGRQLQPPAGRLGCAAAVGLGGWTLDVHHAYDPNEGVLHLGDGRDLGTSDIGPVVSAVIPDTSGISN